MGTKQEPGAHDCYAAAMPDEPLFTLLARDPHAPDVVRLWCQLRQQAIGNGLAPESDTAKVDEAYALAARMEDWRNNQAGA